MGLFRTKDITRFEQALRTGDVPIARAMLDKHPDFLETQFAWGDGFTGFPLNVAAYYNQPEIIEFLVKEKEVRIDRQDRVDNRWSALHHACRNAAPKALKKLLELGADITVTTEGGATVFQDRFFQEADIKKILLAHRAAIAAPKSPVQETVAPGKPEKSGDAWQRLGPSEIVHSRALPDGSCALTDIFNFETRHWTAIVKNNDTGNVAQNIVFFDDVPDNTVLKQALDKLHELGGTAKPCSIERRGRLHKPPVL